MAYFNNTGNANIYSTSFMPSELEAYPFLGQMSTTEEFNIQTDHTLAYPWIMAEQPRHLVGLLTSLGATASCGTHHYHHSSRRLVSDV
jgi:hypothetical protein